VNAARCIYREERDGAHIEIWDEDGRRSLWFDDLILQSEIDLEDPAHLPNPVNRAMLANLVFAPPPRHVLLAGCGGGAIGRWFAAVSPQTRGTAVELSPTVARLARTYFDFPAEGGNWQLVVADIRTYVLQDSTRYDFILVDLEQEQATPDWVTEPAFLGACRQRLADDGILLLNLLTGDAAATGAALFRLRCEFGPETLVLALPEHDNLLALAFSGNTPPLPAAAQLVDASRRWGIDFQALGPLFARIAPEQPASGG
jgi:spermidine synthase